MVYAALLSALSSWLHGTGPACTEGLLKITCNNQHCTLIMLMQGFCTVLLQISCTIAPFCAPLNTRAKPFCTPKNAHPTRPKTTPPNPLALNCSRCLLLPHDHIPAMNPEMQGVVWPGVAGIFQVTCILASGLVFFVSRTPADGGYAGYSGF